MPVFVIAVVSLLLFLIMGAMCLSAVISERKCVRRLEESAEESSTAPAAKSAAAGT